MSLLTTGRQIGRTIKNASRMRTILSVFARHGFANLLERINMGKFLIERISPTPDSETATFPERVRLSFEELGPTFVKFGQLLASRPDLVPQDFIAEFNKLHDSVQPLEFSVIEGVLRDSFGEDYSTLFRSISTTPIGSASIAQVHRAELTDGTVVVLKVQRPGIIQTIQEDLSIVFLLAELLEFYIPEARHFHLTEIVEEYQRSLMLETNFIIEANNIRKFHQNFINEAGIKVPEVRMDLTRDKVLVMEAIAGVALSSEAALRQPGVDPDAVFKLGFNAYLKMVFVDGLFHGDLHAGNLMILPDGRIGLLDFGMVGRLNRKTQSSVAHMLMALAKEDYERMAFEYLELSPFNETVSMERLSRELQNILAPYYGLTMKEANLGKILLMSASVAAKHRLALPSELMLFFKSLVGVESIGRRIKPDFDILAHVTDYAQTLLEERYSKQNIFQDSALILRESQTLISQFPRQAMQLMRKLNNPNVEWKFAVRESPALRNTIAASFNLLFLGIVIASLIFSAALIYSGGQPRQEGAALALLLSAVTLGLIAFVNYIRK